MSGCLRLGWLDTGVLALVCLPFVAIGVDYFVLFACNSFRSPLVIIEGVFPLVITDGLVRSVFLVMLVGSLFPQACSVQLYLWLAGSFSG